MPYHRLHALEHIRVGAYMASHKLDGSLGGIVRVFVFESESVKTVKY